jgi:hypothetical protein
MWTLNDVTLFLPPLVKGRGGFCLKLMADRFFPTGGQGF